MRTTRTLRWCALAVALLAIVVMPSTRADAVGVAPNIGGLNGQVVQLINVDTGRFLDGSTNGNVDQTYQPSEGDRWRFERIFDSAAGDSWRLYNLERPGYLTAEGPASRNNVGLSDAADVSTQWFVTVHDDGSFSFRSALDDRYLDGDFGNKGWNVDTSDGVDEPDTKWRLNLAVQADDPFEISDLDGWVIQLQNWQTRGFADGNTNGNVDQSGAAANGDRWLVTFVDAGLVSLYNLERPGYLTAGDAGSRYNAFLSEATNDTTWWSILRDDDGRYVLESAATGRYLDADGSRWGGNVDTTTKRYDRDSQWRINVIEALRPDTQAPSQPIFDAIGLEPELIEVGWPTSTDNQSGLAGYRLYLDGTLVAELGPDENSYVFADLSPSTTYEVGIEAFDRLGNVSNRRLAVLDTAPPPDLEAPSAPVLFGVVSDIGETTLRTSWDPATDNVGVVGYRIYIFGVPLVDLDAATFEYVWAGLEADTSYTLGVSAFDAAGNESVVTEITLTTIEACGFAKSVQRLVECVSVDAVRDHQAAFQAHADANGGTRAANTPGYQASVDYVATLMTDAGYDVTIQDFVYPVFVELVDAELSQIAPVATDYEYFGDFGFATMFYSGSGDATATTQGVDIIDPTGQDPNTSTSGCEPEDFVDFTAGNIAIMQRGACGFSTKALNAQTAGAVGAVIFNEGQTDREANFLGSLGPDSGVTIPVVGAAYSVGVELVGDGLTPVEARVFASTQVTVESSSNVIADKPGGDLTNTMMVGAHLDSVPEGPGVQDNGTGSGAILEVALQMANVDTQNHLRFAWWGAEEAGLIGSDEYVFTLTDAERAQIKGYLNFDMIGSPNHIFGIYDGDDSDGVGAPAGPPGSAQIEAVFENFFDGAVTNQVIPYQGTDFSGRSDYSAFIFFDIPAGGLFTGAEGIKTPEEAALYGGTAGEQYDPCYHLACDTFDNINLEALSVNSGAVAYATWQLVNTDVISGLISPAGFGADPSTYVGDDHLHAHGMHAEDS